MVKIKTKHWMLNLALGSILSFAAFAEQNDALTHAIVNIDSEVIHEPSRDFLIEMTQVERFTGVALVMRSKNVIHAQAFGKARNEKENELNTVFHVGSVTKQFTAAAIMHLEENGIVELDASINDYLPAKYRSEIWSKVQLHQLLSHTSGIPDYAVTREYYDVTDGWAFRKTVEGMI